MENHHVPTRALALSGGSLWINCSMMLKGGSLLVLLVGRRYYKERQFFAAELGMLTKFLVRGRVPLSQLYPAL
jgi:hypothetical protein